MDLAICKSCNGELVNGMRGMIETKGIRVGTWGIKVGMWVIRVEMWGARGKYTESGCECIPYAGNQSGNAENEGGYAENQHGNAGI